jgi:hypothetical protein
MESSYPTDVAHHIFKLGLTHGHAKISYTLMSKVGLRLPLDYASELTVFIVITELAKWHLGLNAGLPQIWR